jgi:hypothetical protein
VAVGAIVVVIDRWAIRGPIMIVRFHIAVRLIAGGLDINVPHRGMVAMVVRMAIDGTIGRPMVHVVAESPLAR